MSVAAMTLDDQRPLMSDFDPIKKQYDHITNASSGAASVGGAVVIGPASGPASPTPSASEEQQQQLQQQHHHHHHHHHHSGHHHHHLSYHQQHQQQQSASSAQQYQHQQHPQIHDAASAIAVAEQRQRLLEGEIEILKLEQTRLSQQCAEAQRREKILMRRLANKEQEFQDYVSQIAQYKAAQAPGPSALRSALLDPAVNLLFEKLKKELKVTKAKLEETQNELAAWKFTPDSNTGKRLMAKCRLLYQENEELGKMTSNGRLAKLETELAMQKSFSEEVKKSQSELDDFLQELDEDVEGMQSTILFLQQELKTTRDRIQILEKENAQMKNGDASNESTTDFADETQKSQHVAINGNANNTDNDNKEMISHNLNNSKNMITPALSAMNTGAIEGLEESIENEPTDESNVLRNNCNIVNTPATSNDFLIGNEDQAPKVGSATDDNGTSTNSISSNNNVCNKMSHNTAITARKRNYDECEGGADDNTEASPPVIQAPRTLPPKKSKLRVVPARRDSVQSVEIAENDNNAILASSVNANSIVDNKQQIITVKSSVGENGRRFSVREEEAKNSTGGGGSSNGGVPSAPNNTGSISGPPQCTLTRRMSLRISSIGENIA